MEPETILECPACDNRVVTLIGQLGSVKHYRCRACGWNFNVEAESADNEGEEAEA